MGLFSDSVTVKGVIAYINTVNIDAASIEDKAIQTKTCNKQGQTAAILLALKQVLQRTELTDTPLGDAKLFTTFCEQVNTSPTTGKH